MCSGPKQGRSVHEITCRISPEPLKVVLGWRKEVEKLWIDHPHNAARRRTAALAVPGYSVIADNVGWVGRNILEKYH